MAYQTVTVHHKKYPWTSVMASPYSCDNTGILNCAAKLEDLKAYLSNVGEIFFPEGTYLISDNLTIPTGMIIRGPKAVINIAAGKTLTLNGPTFDDIPSFTISNTASLVINGPFNPNLRQIFTDLNVDNDGVIFGSGAVIVVRPEWFDNTTSATALIRACAAIGALNLTLSPGPGTWSLDTNVTIPANICLAPSKGALFEIAATKTLTINGFFKAGSYQVFVSGTVIWNNKQEFLATWVGLIADGSTECRNEFAWAASIASAGKVNLILPSGTIICNPLASISLSGIPKLSCPDGPVIIDSSGVTIDPVFTCYGSRTLIASSQAISAGATTITVDPGSYPQGSVILIASAESLPNTNREGAPIPCYYCKGGRHHVEGYSAPTLSIGPPVEYDFTKAYVYTLDEVNLTIGDEITFKGNTSYNGRGLIVRYAKAHIAANFENFRNGCCTFQDAIGTFSGRITNHYVAGDNGYGLVICDLSEVSILGADIRNCRHCVTGGGGAFWNKTDFGEAAAPVALPGNYTINGGYFENTESYNPGSTSLAIDAHGNMRSAVITGATIRGGLGFNAHHTVIDGNFITWRRRYAIHLSTDNNSLEWGNYIISNNNIRLDGSAILNDSRSAIVMDSAQKCQSINMSGNAIYKYTNTNDSSFTGIYGGCASITITDNEFFASPRTPAGEIAFHIYSTGHLVVDSNKFINIGLRISPKADNLVCYVNSNTVLSNGANGIYFFADTGYYDILNCCGNFIHKCSEQGLMIRSKAISINISNNISKHNNQGGAVGAGVNIILDDSCLSLIARNLDLSDNQTVATQSNGLVLVANAACNAELYLNGINSDKCIGGNTITGANLVYRERYGIRATAGAGAVYYDGLMGVDGSLWRISAAGVLEAF